MTKTFRRDGVRFDYPLGWALEVEADGGAWTATAGSPQTATFTVSARPEIDDPAELAEATLQALTVEYKDLDAAPVVATVAGQPTVGHDIDFLTVDRTALGLTRCLALPAGTLLVLAQVSDYDREAHEPTLRAMIASVAVDDPDAE